MERACPAVRDLLPVALVALFIAIPVLPALTPATGEETPPTYVVWKPDVGPIILNRSIEIPQGEVLRVLPGVTVMFDPGVGIEVKGTLLVEGTKGLPVTFMPNSTRPPEPMSWADVRLHALSAGSEHSVNWARFVGADAGLLVASSHASVEHCSFETCRYGIIARADAWLGVSDSNFTKCSVLGAQWEGGSQGFALRCNFSDMPSGTGVYCDDRSSPEVRECTFSRNYHHASFSQNATGRLSSCTMADSLAEAVECYWNSTPLLEDVTVTGSKATDLYLRNGSRPRFVGGTPLSTWRVFANATDRTCYAIAGKWVQVEVLDLRGRPLEGANVSIIGASDIVLSTGTTGETGRAAHMFMSMYTMGPKGADDRENPQTVAVMLDNSTERFIVTPRELTSDGVLVVVMHVSPFGSAREGSLLWVILAAIVIAVAASAAAAVIVARRRRAAPPLRGHGRRRRQMSK